MDVGTTNNEFVIREKEESDWYNLIMCQYILTSDDHINMNTTTPERRVSNQASNIIINSLARSLFAT